MPWERCECSHGYVFLYAFPWLTFYSLFESLSAVIHSETVHTITVCRL